MQDMFNSKKLPLRLVFDSIMTIAVVPLKVALGWGKFDFWAFRKNTHGHKLDTHLCDFGILGK